MIHGKPWLFAKIAAAAVDDAFIPMRLHALNPTLWTERRLVHLHHFIKFQVFGIKLEFIFAALAGFGHPRHIKIQYLRAAVLRGGAVQGIWKCLQAFLPDWNLKPQLGEAVS